MLTVRDVKKYFPLTQGIVFQRTIGHVKAVDGVSFELRKGETLGVVGESGCGKSTLGRLLMGLETPTEGSIKLLGPRDGRPEAGRRCAALRRNIQIVLQDPYSSLDPRMTVGDIVGEPFDIHPEALEGRERRKVLQELLDVVGLNPDHINRYPHQFSGGQRQRIGIARALALKPKVIVCDEPVSALDVSVQAQVVNLLRAAAGRVRAVLRLHRPRPVRGPSHLRPGDGDVPRQGGRDRRRGPDLQRADPPLHAGAALGRARARPAD